MGPAIGSSHEDFVQGLFHPLKIVRQGMKQLGILAKGNQPYTRCLRIELREEPASRSNLGREDGISRIPYGRSTYPETATEDTYLRFSRPDRMDWSKSPKSTPA